MKSFISFEPSGLKFDGFLSITAINDKVNTEKLASNASRIYQKGIQLLKLILNKINIDKIENKSAHAKYMWQFGDTVYKIKNHLGVLGLEVDDMYAHITRDVVVKKRWLQKVIIFRRYISDGSIIPKNSRWTYFEENTKKKAISLSENHIPN